MPPSKWSESPGKIFCKDGNADADFFWEREKCWAVQLRFSEKMSATAIHSGDKSADLQTVPRQQQQQQSLEIEKWTVMRESVSTVHR